MKILSVDVGGTHVKVLASDETEFRKIDSGPEMTPGEMVRQVKELTRDWSYEAVSIGYPGVVSHDRIDAKPHNLGDGWVGFDFHEAFGVPVKIINDAAMQALGIYEGGRMLFLGVGTGLGSAMIVDGTVVPMELAHLPYRKHRTYEEYLGLAGLRRLGKRKWRKHVWVVVGLLRRALDPDYVILGGGNSRLLQDLPEGVRLGTNASAIVGGFRLWQPRAAVSNIAVSAARVARPED